MVMANVGADFSTGVASSHLKKIPPIGRMRN